MPSFFVKFGLVLGGGDEDSPADKHLLKLDSNLLYQFLYYFKWYISQPTYL